MKYLFLLIALITTSFSFSEEPRPTVWDLERIKIEDDDTLVITTDEFKYTVLESKGYKAKIESNKKGSFSGEEEDSGIIDVFIIEVTLKIRSIVDNKPIKQVQVIPEKTIIREKGSSIEIYKEPERIIETETNIKPSKEAPNLKVKVKEKLYNPFQGILKKHDGTLVNLTYKDDTDIIPIIPSSVNIFDCDKIVIYYITEERLSFIYEFGHSFYDKMFDDTFDVFKPLNPVMVKE